MIVKMVTVIRAFKMESSEAWQKGDPLREEKTVFEALYPWMSVEAAIKEAQRYYREHGVVLEIETYERVPTNHLSVPVQVPGEPNW